MADGFGLVKWSWMPSSWPVVPFIWSLRRCLDCNLGLNFALQWLGFRISGMNSRELSNLKLIVSYLC